MVQYTFSPGATSSCGVRIGVTAPIGSACSCTRPSVPVDTLLRLLYLKHRYGLGYESLCREVADSISWRRP